MQNKPVPYLIPQHIRKIFVNKIIDDTGHANIDPKLRLELRNRFIADGRLEVVDILEKADAYLDVQIVRYLIEPITYDSNFIIEKQKLWVLADLRFTDRTSGKVLWVEKRLSSQMVFNVRSSSALEPSTENDAVEIVIKDLSTQILKRTIEGWFAASGISEKH